MKEIIIAGAGITGLMAASTLAAKGYHITILEATNRAGGRVHTINNNSFSRPVEAGAEFVHGKLPVTLSLLKEAGIEYHPVKGAMVRVRNAQWQEQDELVTGWDDLMEKMHEMKKDMTIAAFLETYFAEERYKDLRQSIKSFAEGYDLADTSIASLFALRDEWMHEEEEQYRLPDGYIQLVQYLVNHIKKQGGIIYTNAIVKHIRWQRNQVDITVASGEIYKADKVIITVPLGVLQAQDNAIAAINFQPQPAAHLQAAQQIGFGPVIKILLQFKDAFYTAYHDHLGFILSNEVIPTWWTQYDNPYPLLTGWVGGERALLHNNTSDDELLKLSLQSLSNIFKIDVADLQEQLTASHIARWHLDDFALGGYSYSMLASDEARKQLNTPVEDTLFFAGEGTYDGAYPGTVEAALVAGMEVARLIHAGS